MQIWVWDLYHSFPSLWRTLFFARQVYWQWVYSTCLSEKVSPSLLNNFTGYRILGWAFLCVCLNTLKYCIPLSLIAWFLRRYLMLFLSLVLKRFFPLWLLPRFFLWFSTVWIWYSAADFGGHLSCLLFSWVSCTYVWH